MTTGTDMSKDKVDELAITGRFGESLKRSGRDVLRDRAESIAENTEMVFRRSVEDAKFNIKKMKKNLQNILDLSPTDANSLIIANDFDAAEFVKRYTKLSVDIQQAELVLGIQEKAYSYLFGKEI